MKKACSKDQDKQLKSYLELPSPSGVLTSGQTTVESQPLLLWKTMSAPGPLPSGNCLGFYSKLPLGPSCVKASLYIFNWTLKGRNSMPIKINITSPRTPPPPQDVLMPPRGTSSVHASQVHVWPAEHRLFATEITFNLFLCGPI